MAEPANLEPPMEPVYADPSTSIPNTIIYQAPLPVASDFQVNDEVQLLRDDPEDPEEPTEAVQGVVSGISGTALVLGSHLYDAEDGWQFTLVKRPVTLPTTLSEIVATLKDNSVEQLMGKGEVWTTETGVSVPVDQIMSYTMLPEE